MLVELAIVLLLIVVNGVLSGAEIAVVSMRRTRVQALVDAGRRGARALAALRAAPERFFSTVQIGITVVGTTAGALGGATVAATVEPLLRPWLGRHAHDVAMGIVVAIISYLSLVLGELVPKSLALRAAEPYALLLSRGLLTLSSVARPLVWLLTASSNAVLRPFTDRTDFVEARVSKEEIEQLVEEAAKTGALDERTTELASRALQFSGLTGADVMVPRNRVVALPKDASRDVIKRSLVEHRRSRVIVHDGNLDNVLGYVTAKDLLPLAWDGGQIALTEVLRPIRAFIETTPAPELLQFMRQERQRLAILVDEHGALAGLVTVEDLVEELAGEFFGEYDRQADPIVKSEDGSFHVRGDVAIRDVRRELDIDLDAPEGVTTVAGLCIVLAGGVVPQRGARLAARTGAALEVLEVSGRAVRRVRVLPPPPAPTEVPPKET